MKRILLCIIAGLCASVPSLPAQKATPAKLLIAFGSYRDRPRHSNILFYEHDGVANGKVVGNVGTPRAADAAGHPVLSQDGRYCIFTFEIEDSSSRIFCWDRKDQKLVEMPVINDSPNAQNRPTFSNDGNLIAFNAWDRPGSGLGVGYHIFLYDRPGKKLIDVPGLNSQGFDDRLPALSGDGRYLAFASNRKGGAGLTDIYLYGRKEGKILDVPGLNTKHTEMEPWLNADGSLLVFMSERPGGAGGRDIYLLDRKAGKYLPMPGLNTPSHEYSPSISPDGRYVVFVSERLEGQGERDIYLYDRETQKLLPTPGLNSKTEDYDPCVMVLKASE